MWGEIERRRSDSSTSGTFHQSDPRARRDASLNRPRFALFPRLRALAAISLLFGFGLVAAPPPAQANWGGFCGPGGCPTLSAAIDSIIAARPNSYLHYSTWEGNSLRLCVGYFVQLKCTWNDLVSPVCPAGEEASRTAENGCALVQQASNGDACTPPAPNTPGDSTKFQQVVDFETPGPNKLAFIRSYNSMSTYDTNMGSGWRNNYSQRLLFKLGGAERWLVTADGMRRKYWNNGGVWQPKDNDTVITVETVGSGLEVTYTDDTVETYDAAGKLLSILKRNGYEQTLAYDGNGDLASVTDSYGRALTFTITDGLITGMTDPDGNVTTYVYGESDPALKLSIPDRLDEVVYPDDTPLDDTDNPREQYLYETASPPGPTTPACARPCRSTPAAPNGSTSSTTTSPTRARRPTPWASRPSIPFRRSAAATSWSRRTAWRPRAARPRSAPTPTIPTASSPATRTAKATSRTTTTATPACC
jgi:YD repeat-containing protein